MVVEVNAVRSQTVRGQDHGQVDEIGSGLRGHCPRSFALGRHPGLGATIAAVTNRRGSQNDATPRPGQLKHCRIRVDELAKFDGFPRRRIVGSERVDRPVADWNGVDPSEHLRRPRTSERQIGDRDPVATQPWRELGAGARPPVTGEMAVANQRDVHPTSLPSRLSAIATVCRRAPLPAPPRSR